MSNVSLKTALLRTTILVGAAAIASPAFAQAAKSTVAAADEAAAGDEEIVVTGSLIKNPNLERSAPVTVTSADQIELKQSNVAEEVLREIPGIVPNVGSAVNNGNGGSSFVDLRGLGSQRNIVLLDGNRIAPSGLVGRVDLNNIPLALVERVEVLTGGASTTYGADAVSGVVNFITKQNFQGVDVSASEQITEKGDGNTFRADVTMGGNFDDDKGNVVLSIGYQESDPVYQGARDFGAFNISSFSGTFGGSGTAIPSRFSGTRPTLAGTTTPDTNPATPNGGVRQIDTRTGSATAGAAVGTFNLFNFNPFNVFNTPFKRFNIFAQGKYEFTDNVELYTRALFSKNQVNTIIAPSGVFGAPVTIPLSNPYLPAALRNQFCAFNTATAAGVYTPRFTPAECTAAATALTAADPNFRTVNVTLNRRTTEVGPRISEFATTIFDYRAGLRGKLTDTIDWDVSGSYGESENTQTQQNYVLTSRIRSAVFATNVNTCLANAPLGSTASGCVPVNIFGPEGAITANQIPFLTANSTSTNKTSLAQGRGTINGDFGISAPWAEDAIGFAAGTEYRKYRASQLSDTLSQQAGELGGAGGAAPNINGGYDVWEGFGELVVPLVQDKPGFQNLTIDAGIRYSSYKVDAAGDPSYKTTTYKAGGSWEPVDGLKIRGNYSHAVRAPNIAELFTPVTTGLTTLTNDPCASLTNAGLPIAGRQPQAANLRAVCIAQGATAGTVNSIQQPTANQANVTQGGNINLRPETSNSYTIGTVIQPAVVPGLAVTVDYYHIKIKGAVSAPTAADAVFACFGNITAASATDPNCTGIRRNPLTGGLDGDPAITGGLLTAITNLGIAETSGVDFSVNYSRDVGFAKLALSLTGNYTIESKFNSNPLGVGAVNRECVGFYSANCGSPAGTNPGSLQPKFQWSQRTTLSFKQIDVSLLWRHIDNFIQEPIDANGPAFIGSLTAGSALAAATAAGNSFVGAAVDITKIKAYDYFDLSTRVAVNDNLSLTVTVQNLFDKQPPLTGSGVGTTGFNSGNTYPSTYDSLGRRFAVAARLKF